FGNSVVIVAASPQVGVTTPIVRNDQRPRSDGATDKSTKRFGASICGDRQPDAPRIAPILSLVLRGSRLAMAHLDGAGDQNLVVYASAFAACPTADPGFVHLDMLARSATDAILVRADHSRAQFVKDLKGSLVTRESELPLELDGRHARGLAGDQVGGPEPSGQRRVASLHDRADSQARLTAAFAAFQHARAGGNAERFASHTAMRTDEAVSPARLFEVFSACSIIRTEPLKFRQRLRKRQFGMLVDVHQSRCGCIHSRSVPSDNRTGLAREEILALVGVCVNRIGKLRTRSMMTSSISITNRRHRHRLRRSRPWLTRSRRSVLVIPHLITRRLSPSKTASSECSMAISFIGVLVARRR